MGKKILSRPAHPVFVEVQAALLNSDCDPVEAGVQGLCALHSFVSTELEGSPLDEALDKALKGLSEQDRMPLFGYPKARK